MAKKNVNLVPIQNDFAQNLLDFSMTPKLHIALFAKCKVNACKGKIYILPDERWKLFNWKTNVECVCMCEK